MMRFHARFRPVVGLMRRLNRYTLHAIWGEELRLPAKLRISHWGLRFSSAGTAGRRHGFVLRIWLVDWHFLRCNKIQAACPGLLAVLLFYFRSALRRKTRPLYVHMHVYTQRNVSLWLFAHNFSIVLLVQQSALTTGLYPLRKHKNMFSQQQSLIYTHMYTWSHYFLNISDTRICFLFVPRHRGWHHRSLWGGFLSHSAMDWNLSSAMLVPVTAALSFVCIVTIDNLFLRCDLSCAQCFLLHGLSMCLCIYI